MFFIFQTIAILAALSLEQPLAKYIACVIPVLYIIVMGIGTFTGGSEISVEKIREQLRLRWTHADELAVYMQRHWYALWYVMSANVRQSNCTILAFMSASTGIYYFIDSNGVVPAVILCISAVVLYLMAMRVNRPLGIFNDPKFRNSFDKQCRTEWRLAATSLVAFSELFPENQNYKFIADMVLSDEVGAGVVGNWRLR